MTSEPETKQLSLKQGLYRHSPSGQYYNLYLASVDFNTGLNALVLLQGKDLAYKHMTVEEFLKVENDFPVFEYVTNTYKDFNEGKKKVETPA